MAKPGEFTRRAFLNGKMDLSEAEAVMDLISSQSERSADLALEQLQGSVSERIRSIEALLIEALSGVNAAIDYPEELEEDVFSALPESLMRASGEMEALIESGLKGRVFREGALVVLAGRPNVGKSSLLNALLGRERAIVTDIPGTTRDILEESLILQGLPLRLMDTAGIRETGDRAERMGVALSKEALEKADLLLILMDQSHGEAEAELLKETAGKERILVLTKSDLGRVEGDFGDIPTLRLSARTGAGLSELKEEILRRLSPGESVLCTNMRHVEALKRAHRALQGAMEAPDADCLSTDIQEALTALGAITGTSVTEAVIDAIFSRFCVGK